MPPLNYDPDAITRYAKTIQYRASQQDLDDIEIIKDRFCYPGIPTAQAIRLAVGYFVAMTEDEFEDRVKAFRDSRPDRDSTQATPTARRSPLGGDALVKFEVRRRDGFRCVDCGLHSEEHRLEYGRGLSVHRLTPGGAYSPENCVTVCVPCHSERHRQMGEAAPETSHND